MPKIKSRSSRRAPPLKDSDYDHEITLFDSAADDVEANGADGTSGGNGVEAEDNGSNNGTPRVNLERTATASPVPEASSNSPSSSNSPNPNTNTNPNSAIDTGDGAGDESATASRRPSGMALTPSSGAALSPVATATSVTPLLNTMSTVPTAVDGPSDTTRKPSRGRNSTIYGSISKVVAESQDGAPSVQVEVATPDVEVPNGSNSKGKQTAAATTVISEQPSRQSMQSVQSANSVRLEPEAAIDILYENERGGFLCGIPLFSRQALGNLDPSPWTNYAHGTSPTDITTAQVPDPSWEWAWPEWRVNREDGGFEDENGWEYSFMFAKCFAWHGPTWYSSFVRRRVWIRKRVRRKNTAHMSATASAIGLGEIDSVTDPHLLNAEYFTVVSAAAMRRSSSRTSSRHASRLSLGAQSLTPSSKSGPGEGAGSVCEGDEDGHEGHDGGYIEMPKEIVNADILMCFLRAARIDREKIEAVDNFLQHAGEDLVRLQDFMHEIMALFVFQASRRALLTLLIKANDEAAAAKQKATEQSEVAEADKGKATEKKEVSSPDDDVDPVHKLQALGRRIGYLTAAVKHADEEVRRLEYWSDIKAMAQKGATNGAVGNGEWNTHQWQGVDRSGPAPPPPKSPSKPTS